MNGMRHWDKAQLANNQTKSRKQRIQSLQDLTSGDLQAAEIAQLGER